MDDQVTSITINKGIPPLKIENNDNQEINNGPSSCECIICFENINSDDALLILECCKQKVHIQCIIDWYLSNPNNKTCFICNQTNKFCEDLTYDTSENTTDNNSTTIQIDNRIYDVETRNHRIKTTITCWSVITIIILSCIIILIIHT